MKHAKTFLGLALASVFVLVVLATMGLGTVIAQGPFDDVMAFIVNDAENPVPVVPAGRNRYQTTFVVLADSSDEDCSPIEVPDGTTFTIDTVGASAQTDGSKLPRTYLRVLNVFAGSAGEDVEYQVDSCVGGVSGDATFNSARGVVAGYLEPGGIVDGLSLP